jgi:hypothetical protein
MPRPDLKRVPPFYHNYINQAPENEIMKALENNAAAFNELLKKIPASKHEYRYADGKWSIKEVLQHIIDGERVFAYRSLCFARKDENPLPGFDENDYVANAKTGNRKWEDLVEEFNVVRKSTQILFGSFDNEQLDQNGVAYENTNYVLGLGFIIAGHCYHHMNVLKERYL